MTAVKGNERKQLKTSGSKLRGTFIRSVPWTVLDGGVSLVYAVVMVVVLGRFLTPAEVGLAGVALAITQFVEAIYASGLQEAVIRSPSGHTRMSDTAHIIVVLFSIAGVVLCLCIGFLLAYFYDQSEIVSLTCAASAGLVLNAFYSVATARLSRKIRTKTLALRLFMAKIFSAATFFISALMGLGAWSIVLSTLASSVGSLVLILSQTNRMPRLRFSRGEAYEIVRFGIISSGSGFCWIAAGRIFAILFGYFHGVEALGYFQFAQRLTDELAALLQVTVVRAGLPLFSGLVREGKNIAYAFLMGTRLLCALATPVYVGLMLVAPSLLPLIFGDRWDPAIPMLWVLATAWIIVFNRTLIPVVLKAQGAPGQNLVFSLITAITAFIGALATAKFSAAVATMGWGIAQVAAFPWQMVIMRKRLGVSLWEQIWQSVPSLAASICMALSVIASRQAFEGALLFEKVIYEIFIGIVAYTAFILIFERTFLVKVRDTFLVK